MCKDANMEPEYVIIGPQGEFEIPVAIRDSMGIVDGMRFRFRQEGARIIAELDTGTPMESNADE